MGVGGTEREGPYAYMLVIHVVTQQKRPQHGKAIILQFKKKKKKKKLHSAKERAVFPSSPHPSHPQTPKLYFWHEYFKGISVYILLRHQE